MDGSVQSLCKQWFHGWTQTLIVLAPLTCMAAPTPTITQQPQSQSASVDSTIEFTVTAEGQSPLNYYWSLNATNVTDGPRISGASTSTLTISGVLPQDAGYYQVIVSNRHDTATSDIAVLTVLPAVRYVDANSAMPSPPYTSWATAAATIQDAIDVAVPGDHIVATNGIYQTGGRVVYGSLTNRVAVTKAVNVRSVNGPAATVIQGYPVLGDTAVRCVYLTNGATLTGFTLTSGATRYTAGDNFLERMGGGVWCETNGVAVLSNCVLVANKASTAGGGAYGAILQGCVLSNNLVSFVTGGGAYECVLSNCTVSGNSAKTSGGGASASLLDHCVLSGNRADNAGGAVDSTLNHCLLLANTSTHLLSSGGGTLNSILNNSILAGNSAVGYGGGASGGTLNNCTLIGNSADAGGGAYNSTLRNSILFNNSAASSGSNYSGGVFTYCCTTPIPNGTGNIANPPLFVDLAAGDLRLSGDSPCINAGLNAYVTSADDLDGNPRVAGGTVDMGAYEYQFPLSTISYAWLQQYGLPTDGSADDLDPDSDAHSTWQEWKAWTNPTNQLSVLRMLSATPQTNGTVVRWQSVTGQSYELERATHPGGPYSVLQAGIPGWISGYNIFTDTTATNGDAYFYRVGVPD